MDSSKYSRGPRYKVSQKVENVTANKNPPKTSTFSARKNRRFRLEKWTKFSSVSHEKVNETSTMSDHTDNSKASSGSPDPDQEDIWDLLEIQIDSTKTDLDLENIPLPPSAPSSTQPTLATNNKPESNSRTNCKL